MSAQGGDSTSKEAAIRNSKQGIHMLQGDTQVPANQGAIKMFKMETLTKTRQWAAGIFFTAGSVQGTVTGCRFAEEVEAVLGAVADGQLELREPVSWPCKIQLGAEADAGTANRSVEQVNVMTQPMGAGLHGPSYTTEEP